MNTVTWSGTLTARSSIAHGGETRGTITLLRRELLILPDGSQVYVPVISGNTLRGRLRRIGEELLRDVLTYEGLLHPAAAHALRGGGQLAKTGHEPLSGSRLATLRSLVPHIAVFGAAGGGTIIDGALDVGKVVPHVQETAHITGQTTTRSAFSATQLEAYTRQDDSDRHDFAGVTTLTIGPDGRPDLTGTETTSQLLFNVETFPAGSAFSAWLRLRRPSELQLAYFLDVLTEFGRSGHLGGRIAIGHGLVDVDVQPDQLVSVDVDWRDHARAHRDEILTALDGLA